jgi:hypothetical protein
MHTTAPQTLPTIVAVEAVNHAARCDGFSQDRDGYVRAILEASATARPQDDTRHWEFEAFGAPLIAMTGLRKGQYVIAVTSRSAAR